MHTYVRSYIATYIYAYVYMPTYIYMRVGKEGIRDKKFGDMKMFQISVAMLNTYLLIKYCIINLNIYYIHN